MNPDAWEFPNPRFRAPRHRTAEVLGSKITAVSRPGPGGLVEARLVLSLSARAPGHCSAVEVYAQLLRTAASEAVGTGAVVRVESRPDRITLSARVFAEDFPRVGAQLGDCLSTDPHVSSARLEAAARTVADRLAAGSGHPVRAARAGFLAAVYGSHPFGLPATAESCGEVDAAAIAALTRDITPERRQAVVVGAPSVDELCGAAAGLLPRRLGPEAGAHGTASCEDPSVPASGVGIAGEFRSGLPQTLLRVGQLVPGRTHEDYPALQLAVLMLGGYYNSRLTLTLRERDGLTYAPRAVLDPVGRTAALTIEADVRAGGLRQALDVIEHEIARLADGGFEPQELLSAKNYAIGTMAMACSSRSGTASALAGILGGGLPASWLAGYEQRIRDIGPDTVARVVTAYLRAPGLTGAVVGPDSGAADPRGQATGRTGLEPIVSV